MDFIITNIINLEPLVPALMDDAIRYGQTSKEHIMANAKKGQITRSLDWAQHLRKEGKRKFWKRERKAQIRAAREAKLTCILQDIT